MWNKYWVLCFTPFYCVLRERGVPQSLGGLLWVMGWTNMRGWWRSVCDVYYLVVGEPHTRVPFIWHAGQEEHQCLRAFLCSPSTCAWRDAMQIWNSRFQILQAKLANSTRGYFPDLIFTSAILQRRALRIASPHLQYRLYNLLLATWRMQWLGTTCN